MFSKLEGVEIIEKVPLKNFTTFRIGGVAKTFVKVYNKEALGKFLKICYNEGIDFFLLGGGSNLLIRDGEIDEFVVVKLEGEFKSCKVLDRGDYARVVVGGGYSLPVLSKLAMDYSLRDIEFCVGIPGSVGGGVIMNAGAHGSEIKDIVDRVFCFSKEGEEFVFSSKDIVFSYRDSSLKDYVVTFVEFILRKGDKEEIKERLEGNLRYRANTQPRGFSAGSVFKNPENFKAWKLIRDVGLAGYKEGEVMFSERHANFIINYGNGKAEDVLKLIRLARKRVFEEFGITLEPEIKFVGLSL